MLRLKHKDLCLLEPVPVSWVYLSDVGHCVVGGTSGRRGLFNDSYKLFTQIVNFTYMNDIE